MQRDNPADERVSGPLFHTDPWQSNGRKDEARDGRIIERWPDWGMERDEGMGKDARNNGEVFEDKAGNGGDDWKMERFEDMIEGAMEVWKWRSDEWDERGILVTDENLPSLHRHFLLKVFWSSYHPILRLCLSHFVSNQFSPPSSSFCLSFTYIGTLFYHHSQSGDRT